MPNQIDIPRAAYLWTEVERTLYNQLPIYLAKRQVEYNQVYDTWTKLLRPQKWSPNMGNIMKGVNKVKSPILRAQFLPNVITSMPRKDVIEVRETGEQVQLYRQDVDTNVFQFLPSFQDFLTDHVDAHEEDMVEKQMVLKDLFYRTAIFHGSPKVYICGATPAVVNAPYWVSPNIALSKTAAYLQANIIPNTLATLSLEHLKRIGTILYNDLNVTPYTGKVLPDGSDGSGLKLKYCLVTGTEVWDGFTDTGSYLLQNRKLDLDIVTGPFTGSLFGRWTAKFERYEMRIAEDGTVPAPETIQANPNEYNFGEAVPNPAYVDAPIGVAFAVGYESYKGVQIGAPPALFAEGAGAMTMRQFAGMDWSGKITHTRNVMVNSLNQDNVVVQDTNKRGEYLQLISDLAMGILPNQRRAVLPIIYMRQRIAI